MSNSDSSQATTAKEVAGKSTKAADKANKKK